MAEIYSAERAHIEGLLSGAACSFGVFDGVHKGHRYVIDRAIEAAREFEAACATEVARASAGSHATGSRATGSSATGSSATGSGATGSGATGSGATGSGAIHRGAGKCVVLTFDIDPDEAFRPAETKKLMTNEDRVATLAALDVDGVVVFPFTREFASQEPDAFLEQAFSSGVPSSIHVGADFRFGAKAAGRLADLERWGSCAGMLVHGYDLLEDDGLPVTASRIRRLLAEGRIEEANYLLGRSYSVSAEVQQGRGEGRDFGFKTANLHVPVQLHVLGEGVYAAYAYVDGVRYKAAVSNGVSPTFAEEARANVECHILDFEGDLYGKPISVEFVHWLRPMMAFSSVDELIATVMGNINWVRENL